MENTNRLNADGAFNPRFGKEDFFWYTPTTGAVILSVAAPAASQQIQIDSDADFFWIATSYQADIAGATLTDATNVIPLVTLQIADTGSGKYMSNAPIPLSTFAGDGRLPYRLIAPRSFAANSVIQLNWANYVTGGTVQSVRIVLHGYKRYI